MTAGNKKLRIALAVFEQARALHPVLAALLADGTPMAGIGLIALETTAAGVGAGTANIDQNGSLSALIGALVPLSGAHGAKVLASPGLVALWRAGLNAPGLWTGDQAATRDPRLAADLARHVQAGAIILAVQSTTSSEHWHCTRLLLEQSSSPVLALECSLPSDG